MLKAARREETTIEHTSHIGYVGEIREEVLQIRQFRIVRIVEPTRYRDSIVGMEDVGSGGIVDDDGFANRSAKL